MLPHLVRNSKNSDKSVTTPIDDAFIRTQQVLPSHGNIVTNFLIGENDGVTGAPYTQRGRYPLTYK